MIAAKISVHFLFKDTVNDSLKIPDVEHVEINENRFDRINPGLLSLIKK
jgi:hypothetical protein